VELSENAQKVAESRYFRNGEDWESCCRRVSHKIASVEEKEVKEEWEEKFFDMIYNLHALPGGRVLRNADYSNKLLNCHVLELPDSIRGIGDFLCKALVLNAEGGGIGCCPAIRPEGEEIKGKGGNSSGVLSFLRAISVVLDTVESGGARRSGLLPILPITHPETLEFIESKLKKDELNNFNISVGITNEFLDAVEQDKVWTFIFEGKEYGKIDAKLLFDKVISNMILSGEPGIVNLDKMKINNSWYFSPISSLNLCGELSLSVDQSCALGSLVLPNYVEGTRTKWEEMRKYIPILVRFIDNVLEVNSYEFPEMREATMSCRRLGIGFMGLQEYLFAKKVRYGSEGGLAKTEEVVRVLRNELYKASIELAKERGSFPGYNEWTYSKAKFIKTLPAHIRMDIKKHGIHNCTMMAFAPTGTISLIADTTSGIEPLPAKAYKRKDRVGERIYIHPLYKQFIENGEEIPDWFVDALELTPEEHFETTAVIQKLNDSSISKTQNLPSTTTKEQLKDWILEYARDLIGITVYVDGSRKDQIINHLGEDEVRKIIESEKEIQTNVEVEDVQCNTGVCEL